MRTNQLIAIKQHNLSLNLIPNKKVIYIKTDFNQYSHDFCATMPDNIWKGKETPKNCYTLVSLDIESSINGLIYNPDEEGNVCALYGLPN